MIRPSRGLHRGGRPAVSKNRASGHGRGRVPVGHQSPNISRVFNAANHTQRMKMGVDYRIRATSNAVAGHLRAAGPTKAPKVRGRR